MGRDTSEPSLGNVDVIMLQMLNMQERSEAGWHDDVDAADARLVAGTQILRSL